MLKLIGCLLLIGSGYGLGEYCYRRALARRSCIREGVELLLFLRQQLQYRAPTAELLAGQIRLENRWPSYIPNIDRPFPFAVPSCFSQAEGAVLAQCFGGIGHQVTQQSCASMEYYIRWLNSLLAEQEQVCRQAARLYRQLGLCAGLGAAILLL